MERIKKTEEKKLAKEGSKDRNKDTVRQGGKRAGGDAAAKVEIKMERVREGRDSERKRWRTRKKRRGD